MTKLTEIDGSIYVMGVAVKGPTSLTRVSLNPDDENYYENIYGDLSHLPTDLFVDSQVMIYDMHLSKLLSELSVYLGENYPGSIYCKRITTGTKCEIDMGFAVLTSKLVGHSYNAIVATLSYDSALDLSYVVIKYVGSDLKLTEELNNAYSYTLGDGNILIDMISDFNNSVYGNYYTLEVKIVESTENFNVMAHQPNTAITLDFPSNYINLQETPVIIYSSTKTYTVGVGETNFISDYEFKNIRNVKAIVKIKLDKSKFVYDSEYHKYIYNLPVDTKWDHTNVEVIDLQSNVSYIVNKNKLFITQTNYNKLIDNADIMYKYAVTIIASDNSYLTEWYSCVVQDNTIVFGAELPFDLEFDVDVYRLVNDSDIEIIHRNEDYLYGGSTVDLDKIQVAVKLAEIDGNIEIIFKHVINLRSTETYNPNYGIDYSLNYIDTYFMKLTNSLRSILTTYPQLYDAATQGMPTDIIIGGLRLTIPNKVYNSNGDITIVNVNYFTEIMEVFKSLIDSGYLYRCYVNLGMMLDSDIDNYIELLHNYSDILITYAEHVVMKEFKFVVGGAYVTLTQVNGGIEFPVNFALYSLALTKLRSISRSKIGDGIVSPYIRTVLTEVDYCLVETVPLYNNSEIYIGQLNDDLGTYPICATDDLYTNFLHYISNSYYYDNFILIINYIKLALYQKIQKITPLTDEQQFPILESIATTVEQLYSELDVSVRFEIIETDIETQVEKLKVKITIGEYSDSVVF